MSKYTHSVYDGIFYRLEKLGTYVAKAPLYVSNPIALETCFEKMRTELKYLKLHLTLQNIQCWNSLSSKIEEGIARDANNNNTFLIEGIRELHKDENGCDFLKYNLEITITE